MGRYRKASVVVLAWVIVILVIMTVTRPLVLSLYHGDLITLDNIMIGMFMPTLLFLPMVFVFEVLFMATLEVLDDGV